MVLRTMKNHSPLTLMAAALLGAAVATTTLLTNEPLGLSLTPRLETYLPTYRSAFRGLRPKNLPTFVP